MTPEQYALARRLSGLGVKMQSGSVYLLLDAALDEIDRLYANLEDPND